VERIHRHRCGKFSLNALCAQPQQVRCLTHIDVRCTGA
jgi:hypothetical protein